MSDVHPDEPGDRDAAAPEPADVAEPPAEPEPVNAEPVNPQPVNLAKGEPVEPAEPVADAADGASIAPVSPGRRWYGRRKPPPGTPAKKAPWWELPALVLLAIVIAILVKTFLVQPFYIPSASMEKTLAGSPQMGNDRILVNKLIYDFRDPHPGDIVVFNAPPGWDDEPHSTPPGNIILRGIRGFGQLIGFVPPDGEVLVKRVIAIGGQTVQGKDGHVYVDGKQLQESSYVFEDGSDVHATFGPVTVPKGRLWVMGDHRNDSEDSRFHCGPNATDEGGPDDSTCETYRMQATVPVDDVIGKAFVVAWPPSHWRTLGTPKTFEGLASALNSAVPSGAGLFAVAPLYAWRRSRRRRGPGRRRAAMR